jgi:integrase
MKRGMGCVYRRKDGKIWWIKYSFEGVARYESSKSTIKGDAIDLLKKRLNIPTPASNARVTVDELLDDLLVYYKVHRPKSYKNFCVPVVANLRKYFKDWKAAKVTTNIVNDYKNLRHEQEKANGTINRELALLRRAYRLAFEATPPKIAAIPKFKFLPEAKPRQGFLEPEQYQHLLQFFPKHLQPIVIVAYHTGARKSEILNLRRDQIDLVGGYITLYTGETKNGQGRSLPIYGEMESVLKELMAVETPSPWLFIYPDGSRINNVRGSWKSICTKAGMPNLLFHDFRRSAIRNMIRAGVSEHTAMKVSGHESAGIFRRYNIISRKDIDLAVKKMEVFMKSPAVAGESKISDKKSDKKTTDSSDMLKPMDMFSYMGVENTDHWSGKTDTLETPDDEDK